jgi:hypothetical protein
VVPQLPNEHDAGALLNKFSVGHSEGRGFGGVVMVTPATTFCTVAARTLLSKRQAKQKDADAMNDLILIVHQAKKG